MADDQSGPQRVTRFRMTARVAEQRIKELAASSENIQWSRHALDRMFERDIVDIDVLRVLRTGTISGEPEPTERGEWKCKMVQQIRGGRDVGVVTIILNLGLLIKTVEWEDLQ